MLYKGLQYLASLLITSHPTACADQSKPAGSSTRSWGRSSSASWASSSRRRWRSRRRCGWSSTGARVARAARRVGIEVIAGTPDIVLAIFGLVLFQPGPVHLDVADRRGRSGVRPVVPDRRLHDVADRAADGLRATREGLQSIPSHLREASYGLARTKIATIRRVRCARAAETSGPAWARHGPDRRDTAIVVILLGATLTLESESSVPGFNVLKGTGSTLTSYDYNNSPAGEGNAPQKAYAAAFVLLVIVIGLNFGRRPHHPGPQGVRGRSTQQVITEEEHPVESTLPPADPADQRGRAADRRHDAAAGSAQRLPEARRRRGQGAMTLDALSVAYGEKLAVKEVSLPIRQGEVLALIGPSGCGKTTLLRTLNRLTELTPTASRSGGISLERAEHRRARGDRPAQRVSMVFQQPNPFPMSVFDNVRLRHPRAGAQEARQGRGAPQVETRSSAPALWRGLSRTSTPALRLSGGQQQRLCIARALAAQPEVLLMDEPCSALDPASTARIEELIGELRVDLAIVIVTHNLQQAYRVADHVAFMYLGDLVEYGPAEQVFSAPVAERTRAYVSGAFG